MSERPQPPLSADQEILDHYSSRLEFVWEKWSTFINIIITFSGGTVVLLFNSLGGFQAEDLVFGKPLIVASVSLACFALAMSILWRLTAQHFLETDLLSPRRSLERYQEILQIPRGISYGSFQVGYQGLMRVTYYVSFVTSVVALPASWVVGLLFVAKHL